MLPFARITIIGLGLIGSSIARGVRAHMSGVRLTGYDADPQVRETAKAIGLCDDVADSAGAAVTDADLVILCVPVGAIGDAAREFAEDLPADAVVSDVGSCKESVVTALREALGSDGALFVTPGDAEALAQGIRSAVADRDGSSGRAAAAARRCDGRTYEARALALAACVGGRSAA